MNIPLNGRIAIVDDRIDHALPLINVLSQKKFPCHYYSGKQRYLPAEGEAPNDIRILFLDINLLDDAIRPANELKSTLVGVLNRVISTSNFPWVLIYWSRHEEDHKTLVNEIFNTILTDRKPILYLSQQKSDYFSLGGEETADFEVKVQGLFDKIVQTLAEQPAYRQLIAWENILHKSADKTLKDVFSVIHELENWPEQAAFLLNRLGESYAGKDFQDASPEEKVRQAFQTLNTVFMDTQEYETNNDRIPEVGDLFDKAEISKVEAVFRINKKLLLSVDRHNICYSGMVIADTDPAAEQQFLNLLNSTFNRHKIQQENPGVVGKALDKKSGECRQAIRDTWKKVRVVVTPLCDVVQQKVVYNKMVQGFLVRAELAKYVDDKSEAIYISPPFQLGEHAYILVLNFRYFYTAPFDPKKPAPEGLTPLFRIRQSLLAEIQSKLARHTNRQGVLYIDTH